MEPNNEDWRRVFNAYTRVINNIRKKILELTGEEYPEQPYLRESDNCIPTEEYWALWKEQFPHLDARGKFTKMAHDEMHRRIKMEKFPLTFFKDPLR